MVGVIYVGIRYVPTYDFTTYVTPPPAEPSHLDPTGSPAQAPTTAPRPGTPFDTGRPIRTKEDVWNTVLVVSVGGLLVVTAAGLAAGWLLSRRLLSPLSAISRAAVRAGEGDLACRINAAGPHDELRRLADTFDTALARLEESFAAHRRFAANASHELLTPLSTTRAALQLVSADAGAEELAELLPVLVKTNDRNISVVRALLRLAEAERGAYDDPEPVDLVPLLREEAARIRAARPEGPSLRVRAPREGPEVRGNETLLRQLVANLLDNAVLHNLPPDADGADAPASVTARITVSPLPGVQGRGEGPGREQVVLEIGNTGPEMDPETVDRLFEPFYRARPRIGGDRGHGLGLALVRAVAHAHGGTATATARPGGGLLVRVRLPAAGKPAACGHP
ncbi:sensor histidine kinase [Streptomyces lavendulae]|uniref:sensor histidine kinase n=1 Tax=Streptomyces lavendulae TaxID=1914 RepID=UPI0037FAFF1C